MIDRREFVRLAALAGATEVAAPLAASAADGASLHGTVAGGGRPLTGVAVTNGRDVVKTDAAGRFTLPAWERARFLSVTTPSGWRAERFYIPVSGADEKYDFALLPWAPSAVDRPLRFVHISDSEIGRIADVERTFAAHVKEIADRCDAAFIVHTGDICYPGGLRAHIKLMNDGNMGRPMFYTIGNHDLVKEGDCGEHLFESLYGPVWHSFEACGVHVCSTPMLCGDVPPSYTPAMFAEWLKNDLAAIPRDMPVVLLNHSFWGSNIFDVRKLDQGVLTVAGFDAAAACNLSGVVYGHLHTNQFRRFGKVAAIQTSNPQMGGVDLNPASVRIVKADKSGRLTSETRYAPKDVWPGVATAEKGLWRTKLPGPVYLGSPVTGGRLVFVGTLDDDGLGTGAVVALDPSNGKVAWTAKMPNSIKNQMVVCRGRVVCQDADGTVHALDCTTGAEAWAVRAKGVWLRPFEHGIAADEATGTVFTEFEERFVAFDVATGAEKWRAKEFKLYGTAASCAAFGDGIVTGEVQWHGLYACDPATGKKIWSRDRKGPQGAKEQLRWRSGTVTISGGKVYATGGKNFYVLDAKTGETIAEHSYKISLGTTTKPLLLGGRIYLGSCDAGLVALDEKTLDIVWTGDVGEALVVSGSYKKAPQKQVATHPLPVSGGGVLAAAGDGTIRVWDAATGRETRRIATGAPYFNAPLVAGGRIIAADFAGYVHAFSEKA